VALLGLALIVVLGACKKRQSDGASTSASAAPQVASAALAPAPAVPRTRQGFEVSTPDGSQHLRLVPDTGGYRLEAKNGDARGRVEVQPDRVKVENPAGGEQAKVKSKDYGFKVYAAGDTVVLKAKRRGSGFTFKRGDDSPLGRWEEGRGTLAGEELAVIERGGNRVVLRGGKEVASVSAAVPEDAAALLALTELSFEQRLATLVFRLELVKP
jgi:hypothetical protein